MTREIALHCMKSYSELHSDLCELCPIYGQTGSDHCFEDALQYVIGMLEQEPTTENDLEVQKAIEIIKADSLASYSVNEISSARDLAVEALKQMATTKNDLRVDCIDRAQAQAEIEMNALRYTIAKERGGMGQVEWSDQLIKVSDAVNIIRKLPPVTPQELRWIPVSERLPNTEDEVLCWYEYYHWSQEKILPEYGLGCYFKETKSWFGEVANGKDVRVIAWIPLPQAYREVEE